MSYKKILTESVMKSDADDQLKIGVCELLDSCPNDLLLKNADIINNKDHFVLQLEKNLVTVYEHFFSYSKKKDALMSEKELKIFWTNIK